jgi:pSer/pThr/pTyr-binding forkhead associated (FHA) protein
MSRLALRFISGKYKGGEYILKEGRDIVIGRSSELDVVLMEDMVSRRHAVLVVKKGKINIVDRGSTNGTFVNGEKISKAVVSKGDRILIGTSIMKVVDANEDAPDMATSESTMASRQSYQDMGKNTVHSGSRSMTGTIAEVPLPDLIQLFSTSKKTGTLALRRGKLVAKIHMDKGKLVHATINDSPDLSPVKAIYRILSWEDGTFELLGSESHNFPDQINMPTEHILMEGLRQLDELRHAQGKLPPMDSTLIVCIPLEPKLADLEDQSLAIFQIVLEKPTVQQVLDKTVLSDSESATVLRTLIKNKYVKIAGEAK